MVPLYFLLEYRRSSHAVPGAVAIEGLEESAMKEEMMKGKKSNLRLNVYLPGWSLKIILSYLGNGFISRTVAIFI